MLFARRVFWAPCLVALAIFGFATSAQASVLCDRCVPAHLVFNPGIGFDLTLEYGTAAARYYNGSVSTIGRVEGDEEYKALMLRFLEEQKLGEKAGGDQQWPLAEHATPLDRTYSEGTASEEQWSFSNVLLHVLQWAKNIVRYILGKKPRRDPPEPVPSAPTPEVETLIRMLDRLKATTERYFHRHLNSTGISVPNFFTRSQRELVMSAASRIGFEILDRPGLLDESAATAGIVAAGIGMCEHYRVLEACAFEKMPWGDERVLVVDYGKAALDTTYHPFYQRLTGTYAWDLVEADLGATSRWRSENGEEAYWERVKDQIAALPRRAESFPTQLVLMGDSVADETFRDALRDALTELLVHSDDVEELTGAEIDLHRSTIAALLRTRTVDPVFAAAIGAAELAKRTMESPPGCLEPRWCYQHRGEEGPN